MESSCGTDFRHELARVLSSTTFAQAAKQRDLLKWLVEQTLSGQAEAFSQYAIATSALDYSADFDPTSDSRVRTAVRRLRERLTDYYQKEGRLNRFRISIGDGQYTPQLLQADLLPSLPAPGPALSSSASLAVLVLPFLPVGFYDDDCFCDGLTLNLMRALAGSGQARVVPWTTAHWLADKTGDKREHYLKTNADVILEGLVQESSKKKWNITVQWVDGPTGLFDHFYQVRGESAAVLSMVDELAGQITNALRVTYDERVRARLTLRHSNDLAALTFYLRARRDAMTFTPPRIRRAFELVAHAVGRDPYFAAAHALQAELHLAVGDSGTAQATPHAKLARESSEQALVIAPELGDALAARGAIELTYDWDLARAEETLTSACSDALADAAPHWPPILDLARGKNEEAAQRFEAWARLDPGCGAKAGVAAEFWYYARRFDLAIRWGYTALELDEQNVRAASIVAGSHMELGNKDESLRLAREYNTYAPELCETNLLLATLLAQAKQHADARQVLDRWNERKANTYEPPILLAVAHAWLGDISQALDAMRRVVDDRQTVCLFARSAPYLAPLHAQPGFADMLNEAGAP